MGENKFLDLLGLQNSKIGSISRFIVYRNKRLCKKGEV
jgi:hypothetical protein